MNVTLTSAADISAEQLLSTFNLSYSDYMVPLQLNAAQLQGTIDHYDLDLRQSCVALVDNDPVGMGFLGVRGQRGWIGGMGVIPDFRGQGIGRKIMNQLIANGRALSLDAIGLEVIEGNKAAHQLYLSLGFTESRRLLIVQIKEIPQIDGAGEFVESSLDDALTYFSVFHQVGNPWQREKETLTKSHELGAWLYRQDEQVAAYLIGRTTPQMIQIMDIGLAPNSGEQLTHFMSLLSDAQPDTPASMVNLPEDDPAWPLMHNMGFTESLAQIEMVYSLK